MMAEELTTEDVDTYTQGRIDKDDPETARALAAALSRARRACGWHVTPVVESTVRLHGSGHDFIVLPTLKPVELLSITEDGEEVDLDEVYFVSREPGVLYKKCGWWCRGPIEVTLTHGFTAEEAGDFREVVLQAVDVANLMVGTGATGPITGLEVDDVNMRWSGLVDRSWGIAKNPMLESVLYQYRLVAIA
ncbi:head-to-tail adaptor [Mycobacterium phage Lucky2013]|nr:head-to-tail adaptor [Mycobacterium phage Lucky2013]